MKFTTKARRLERWAGEAQAYSVQVLTWQLTVAKDLPATIRVTDRASRAIFLAAEASRSNLEVKRQRLLMEAVELGVDSPDLPEASWPEERKAARPESLYPEAL